METHKSKYNDGTVRLLNECRTIVPSGDFNDDVKIKQLIEIDENEALTYAVQSIKHIPTLSAFDTWMPYDAEDMSEMIKLTQCYVEAL